MSENPKSPMVQSEKPRRGRPPIPGGQKFSRCCVSLPPDLHAFARHQAFLHQMSTSEYFARLMRLDQTRNLIRVKK